MGNQKSNIKKKPNVKMKKQKNLYFMTRKGQQMIQTNIKIQPQIVQKLNNNQQNINSWQQAFQKIETLHIQWLFLNDNQQSQIIWTLMTSVFTNLQCLELQGNKINNIQPLQFLQSEVIKELVLDNNEIFSLKPLQKVKWSFFDTLQFEQNPVIKFDINRIKNSYQIDTLSFKFTFKNKTIIQQNISHLAKIQAQNIQWKAFNTLNIKQVISLFKAGNKNATKNTFIIKQENEKTMIFLFFLDVYIYQLTLKKQTINKQKVIKLKFQFFCKNETKQVGQQTKQIIIKSQDTFIMLPTNPTNQLTKYYTLKPNSSQISQQKQFILNYRILYIVQGQFLANEWPLIFNKIQKFNHFILDLSENFYSKIIKHLQNHQFVNLVELNLSVNYINNLQALEFTDCQQLQRLNLSYNDIFSIKPLSKLKWNKIKTLDIKENPLRQVSFNRIKTSKYFDKLCILSLYRHKPIQQEDYTLLAKFEPQLMEKLQILDYFLFDQRKQVRESLKKKYHSKILVYKDDESI